MVKYTADSSFLVDLLRGIAGAVRTTQELEAEGAEIYTTAINSYELLLGARRLNRLRATEAMLADISILELTSEAASEAARIAYDQGRRGRAWDHRDALMVGISLAHGVKSIVSNDNALKSSREITVRTYKP